MDAQTTLAGLDPIAPMSADASAALAKEATKPRDFGQKIGGARKDMKGNVNRDDIARMTPEERLKLVKKDHIWPTPDYDALMQQHGYSKKAVAMVKMLRDELPKAPTLDSSDLDETNRERNYQTYAAMVNAAKQVCEAGMKPASELSLAPAQADSVTHTFLSRKIDESEAAKNYLCHVTRNPMGEVVQTSRPNNLEDVLEAAFNGSQHERYDLSRVLSRFASGFLSPKIERFLKKNPSWPSEISQAERLIQKIGLVPIQKAPETWGAGIHGEVPTADYSYYGRLMKQEGFGGLIGQTFPTSEETEKAILQAAETKLNAQKEAAKSKRATFEARALGAPEDLTGLNTRNYLEGRNAMSEDYLGELSLRGGEFGLWLNDRERQQVLDRGYGAFRDIATTFGMPAAAISLGGRLAIAFGARGNGGNAAAHYEPGRQVINLTKPNGEGCLAHEWAHALDHMLGRRAQELGMVSSVIIPNHAPYLSNVKLNPAGAGMGEEEKFLRDFHKAIGEISRTSLPLSKEDRIEAAKEQLDHTSRNLYVVASNAQGEMRYSTRLPEEQLAGLRAELEAVRTAYRAEQHEAMIAAADKAIANPVRKIALHINDLPDYTERMRWAMQKMAEAQGLPAEWTEPAPRRVSRYHTACRALDKERKTPYYSLPHEMFARTFEALMMDKMREQGTKNEFLVQGAGGEAFPHGKERAYLNDLFAPLVAELPKKVPIMTPEAAAKQQEEEAAMPAMA